MYESVEKKDIRERLEKEREKGSRLITVTAEERKDERYLIYHLDNDDKGIISLEVDLNGNEADRVIDIYENADLYERETREMFGIDFGEEMRNLFLPEEAEEPPMSTVEEAIKSENQSEGGHSHA